MPIHFLHVVVQLFQQHIFKNLHICGKSIGHVVSFLVSQFCSFELFVSILSSIQNCLDCYIFIVSLDIRQWVHPSLYIVYIYFVYIVYIYFFSKVFWLFQIPVYKFENLLIDFYMGKYSEEVKNDLNHEGWIGIGHSLKEMKKYVSEEIENTSYTKKWKDKKEQGEEIIILEKMM